MTIAVHQNVADHHGAASGVGLVVGSGIDAEPHVGVDEADRHVISDRQRNGSNGSFGVS